MKTLLAFRLLALGVLATACGGVVNPLGMNAMLMSKFIAEPESLPPQTSASLTGTPAVGGTVRDWKDGASQPVSLEWPQTIVIGAVSADGVLEATLPADPGGSLAYRPTEEALVRGWFFEHHRDSTCPVTSLVVSPGNARVATPFLRIPLAPVEPLAVRPLTSPPPTHRSLFGTTDGHRTQLVFADRDATVRGERKCIRYHNPEVFDQTNLSANLVLKRGWNVVTTRSVYTATTSVPGVRLTRITVEAAPAAPPTDWVSYGHHGS